MLENPKAGAVQVEPRITYLLNSNQSRINQILEEKNQIISKLHGIYDTNVPEIRIEEEIKKISLDVVGTLEYQYQLLSAVFEDLFAINQKLNSLI